MLKTVVENLLTMDSKKTKRFKISREEFDSFYKEFIFLKLKEIKLGEAFCRKYNEKNFILLLADDDFAKQHIQRYYIKNDVSSN
jgi:hypothetical protein